MAKITRIGAARLQALSAAILFSTGGAGIKVDAFSAAQVSMLRSGIAAVALLIWLRLSRSSKPRVTWSIASLGAGVVYAATLTLFVTSTKLTTAANAIFLQATAPLYLLILSPLVLHERFRPRDVAYLGAVAAGMICCFLGRPEATATAPNPALGNLLGVMCGLVWALTLVALRYIERAPAGAGAAIAAVVFGNALACLGALPLALPLPDASMGEWATIGYLGVFQIGLAYVCLTSAIGHLPAFEVSLLLLLEPALNPVWTWFIRGEQPGPWTIVGGAAIVFGTGVKAIYDARVPIDTTRAASH